MDTVIAIAIPFAVGAIAFITVLAFSVPALIESNITGGRIAHASSQAPRRTTLGDWSAWNLIDGEPNGTGWASAKLPQPKSTDETTDDTQEETVDEPGEEKDLHNFRILRNRFIHSETNDIPDKVINRAQNIDQRLKNRIKTNQNGKGFIYRLILFSIVIISIVYIMLIFS